MPTNLVPASELCGQKTNVGGSCTAPKMKGHPTCYAHDPARRRVEAARAALALERKLVTIDTDLDLNGLMGLDWSNPDALAIARRGIWQHLLAGSIRSDAARAALDVAEQLATASKRKSDKTPMSDVLASVVGTPPPQPDD